MEIIGILILLVTTGWVYSDAKDRGSSSPGLWAFGTLCLLIVFLPLYLIMRPSKNRASKLCPHCGKYYNDNPVFCPNCGQEISVKRKDV